MSGYPAKNHAAKAALLVAFFASLPFCAFAEDVASSAVITPLSASVADPARGPAALQPSKVDVLARLRALQLRQVTEIGTLEDSVKKALKESTNLTLKEDLNAANRKISRLGDALNETDKRRTELLARREIVDQLILLIDSKWDGKSLQAFLEHSLLDIANGDLTNAQGSGDTWRFMTYLSIAIREVPEQREDVLGVLESYMNFASVLNPKSPAEFLAQRNYSNNSESVSARATTRDSIGDYVEKRTRELSKLRTLAPAHSAPMSTVSDRPISAPDSSTSGATSGAASELSNSQLQVISPKTPTPAGDSLSAPKGRQELELRVRKTSPDRFSDPDETRDSGTMLLETPKEDEQPEQMYISPRLKASTASAQISVGKSD